MKHSGPEDDYLYEELEESDDYVYLDEDDDARSAQGSGAVAVLGVIAALCALALVGVIVASIVAPSLFRSKTSDDPDAILHSLHLEQEQELKENPQVQGSTEPTTIYANHTGLITVDGFYEITKAANGVATVNPIMGAYGTGHTAAGTYGGKNTGVKAGNLLWDRGYIYAFDGSSLVNNDMNSDGTFGARYNTYRVNGDTKYFQVTKTTWNNAIGSGTTTQTEITASEAAALSAEDRIVVAYTSNSAYTENVATYVYVLKEVNIGQANPTQAATVKFQLQVMNGNVVEETVSLGYVEMSAGTATFTLANTSTQVDWNYGAPITKDARVTGLTLTGLRNPIVGTQQTVTVTADQYGSELPVVTFQLYR